MSVRLFAVLLLTYSIAALLSCNREPAHPQAAQSINVAASPAKDDGVRRLSVEEFRRAFEKNEAVLVDVRGPVEHELGHPKGAISMPLGLIKTRAAELPRDKMLVTFCACHREELSVRAVEEMAKAGINNAAALVGGLDALVEAGFPTEKTNQE
ncbi:MAG TPA: rhodanese-like domain-containing protein [Pyrinomonadaceae bacterium]|jgi:rhodanese-related sulfurtransferase|nr:rhodanese-like domain-containing protein [Pyrinomonadaceae bacterium]